jgi:hypothetical protein
VVAVARLHSVTKFSKNSFPQFAIPDNFNTTKNKTRQGDFVKIYSILSEMLVVDNATSAVLEYNIYVSNS